MAGAHPGFGAVANSIARREGIPEDRADAILAASTRRAGPAARRKNPRLNRVKGKAKMPVAVGKHAEMMEGMD